MASEIPPHEHRTELGAYALDWKRGALFGPAGELKLRPKSFAVLCHLVGHRGQLVTREELLDAIWGHRAVTEDALTQCLVDIRRALGEEGRDYIRTLPRRGYLLDVPDGDDPPTAMDHSTPSARADRRGPHSTALAAIVSVALATVAWWLIRPEPALEMQPGMRIAGDPGTGSADSAGEAALSSRIAVLPFADMSVGRDHEYIGDGIAEEILNRLATLRDLHVIARTSSFALKDSGYGVPRMSALLGVQYLLQGSVRADGQALRVTAQLVDRSGRQLWSESYDRELGAVFAIQEDIATAVVRRIAPHLRLQAVEKRPQSIEAYQHYLAGRDVVQKRITWRYEHAIEQLSRAIEIDPEFAEAYAERALATSLWAPWLNDYEDAIDRMARDVDTALSLRPDLARAHLARVALLRHRNPESEPPEPILQHILQLDPGMADAHFWLSLRLISEGQLDEGLRILEHAARLDPLSPEIIGMFAHHEAQRGDFASAEARLKRLLDTAHPSDRSYGTLVELYVEQGRLAEAVELEKRFVLANTALGGQPVVIGLGVLYAYLGAWERADYWLQRYAGAWDNYKVQLQGLYVLPQWTGPLGQQGRFEEILVAFQQALDDYGLTLAEISPVPVIDHGATQSLAGAHELAISILERVLDLGKPISAIHFYDIAARQCLAWSYLETGRVDRAREILRELEAVFLAREAEGLMQMGSLLNLYAQNALLSGDADGVIARLQRAVDAGWRGYYKAQHDPRWRSLRDDPRYVELMATVKRDLDQQRAIIDRRDAEVDFSAQLDAAIAAEAARSGRELAGGRDQSGQ